MVAKRLIFTPCPPSPARDATDPKHEDWITSLIADLSTLYPSLNTDVPGFAKALCKLGYDNHANLAFMHVGDPVTEVKNALKINIVLAKAIVSEGLVLHPRDAAVPPSPRRYQSRSRSRSRSPRRSRSPPEHKLRWQIFSDKLH